MKFSDFLADYCVFPYTVRTFSRNRSNFELATEIAELKFCRIDRRSCTVRGHRTGFGCYRSSNKWNGNPSVMYILSRRYMGSRGWSRKGTGEGGGSRKTKDLRRLPRGVRAGGLPASVHSSAGGRRGLPRWRVRGSGGEDDVGS